MVMENTVPATVIMELATVESSKRAPSAPPDQRKPTEVASVLPIAPLSSLMVPNARPTEATAMRVGTNQKLVRRFSHKLSRRAFMRCSRQAAGPVHRRRGRDL